MADERTLTMAQWIEMEGGKGDLAKGQPPAAAAVERAAARDAAMREAAAKAHQKRLSAEAAEERRLAAEAAVRPTALIDLALPTSRIDSRRPQSLRSSGTGAPCRRWLNNSAVGTFQPTASRSGQ